MRYLSSILWSTMVFALFSSPHTSVAQYSVVPSGTADAPADDGRQYIDAVAIIVGDTSTIDFGEMTLHSLAHLAGLDRGAPDADKDYYLEYTIDYEGEMSCRLTGFCPQGTDPNEYLDAAQRRFQEVVSKVHEASMGPLRYRSDVAAQHRAEAEALAEHLTDEVEVLLKKAIDADVFPDTLDQQLGSLKNDRLTLRAEIAGFRARHEAIVTQIKVQSDKLAAAADQGQDVLNELETIVDLRTTQLDAINQMFKSAAASMAEVLDARVKLSTAKADLAERRRQIALEAGSKLLEGLNQQLASVQIELAAASARLEVIDRTLASFESDDVRALVNDYQRATRRLTRALAQEEFAATQLAKTQNAVDAVQPPRVVVFRRSRMPQTATGDEP